MRHKKAHIAEPQSVHSHLNYNGVIIIRMIEMVTATFEMFRRCETNGNLNLFRLQWRDV